MTRPRHPLRASRARSRTLVALAVLACVVSSSQPAAADPARPGHYRSQVLAIEPATEAVTARIVVGDAFIELTVHRGHNVVVDGYQGEAYIHINAAGQVYVNHNSPAHYLNADRYGDATVPATATATIPDWHAESHGGRHLWHDHRTHWMSPNHPIGRQPGDIILDAALPLTIDGRPHRILVRSTWEPGPAPTAAILGGTAALIAIALLIRRHPITLLALAGVAAASLATWEVASLPADAAQGPIAWLAPPAALLLTGAAAYLLRRRRTLGAHAAALAAATELALWCVWRRTVVTRPVLISNAPDWLERAGTSSVAIAAIGLVLYHLPGVAIPVPYGDVPRRRAGTMVR